MLKRVLAVALTVCLSYPKRAEGDTPIARPMCGGPPCSCILSPGFTNRETAAATISAFSAIFEGTVVRIFFATDSVEFRYGNGNAVTGHRTNDLVVTVAVTRRWKGAQGDTITVRTSASTTMCGADFDLGETYLIFARSPDVKYIGAGKAAHVGQVVHTSKCSPTIASNRREARRITALLEPR